MLTQTALEKLYLDRQFVFQKLETKFDLQLIKEIHHSICSQITLKQKDQNPNYRGYCLQSDKKEDPFFGCLQQTRVHNQEHQYIQISDFLFHKQRNAFGDQFAFIFEKFPFQLYQGRVLIAKPGCKIPSHNDGLFRLTLHIPLETNENCLFEINSQSVYLPADGSAYILNTRLPHAFSNEGFTSRVHLVFSLWPICVQSPSEAFKAEFNDFYKKASQFQY